MARPTPSMRRRIYKWAERMCANLKVPVPLILFSPQEVEIWAREVRHYDDREIQSYLRYARKYYGLCLADRKESTPTVYVNAKKRERLCANVSAKGFHNSMEGTLAHELVHYARPSYIERKVDGRAFKLLREVHAPKKVEPTIADKIANLESRKKRLITKTKRLTTNIKKIDKKLNYWKRRAHNKEGG